MDPSPSPRTDRPSRLWKWARRALIACGVGLLVVLLVGVGTYLWFSKDLPSVDALRHYHPPQVTKVRCEDGSVCGQFFTERRTVIDTRRLPKYVKDAFLAAEDADFYHHHGLDYVGIIRAGLKAVLTGHVTGASTITQQACRNILLTRERTLSRKIREWILSLRMENALTKAQILDLYLNQINFGHGRYGIEEAALYYFGKHAENLDIGEAAVLAGTVQLPERINPVSNMKRAKKRQRYVLHQLAEHHFLTQAQVQPWMKAPILLAPRPQPEVGRYYIAEIKQMLTQRYGKKAVESGGLQVQIAMRQGLQQAADEAVRDGLEALDRQMGYGGPVGALPPERFATLRPLIAQRIAQAGRRHPGEELVADMFSLAHLHAGGAAKHAAEVNEELEPETPDQRIAREVDLDPLTEGMRLRGYVTAVDDSTGTATVDLVGRMARLDLKTLHWARKRGVGHWTAPPKHISDVVKPSQIIAVKVLSTPPAPAPLEVTLDPIPRVQGALVAIDPRTRHVVALVGGYEFAFSQFDRAIQAHRQPGSSFKPFVYGAALLSQRYTPVSVLDDAPDPIRDPWTGKVWRPQNYERGMFEGPMTLRKALAESKNTIAVRLIEAVTPDRVIDFAHRAGIHADLPSNFTLALGTGEVTPLGIANAYATFDSAGKYADPILLEEVKDASGQLLESHQAAFEETLPPPVAFLTTSMLESVVADVDGTGRRARVLDRPVAAKTGTASDFRDAWFIGYTPDLVTAVWVGFDDHRSLGHGETGARAALPIWIPFMEKAEANVPAEDFSVPTGVDMVRIDPVTHLLAGNAVPGQLQPFLPGTAPTKLAPAPGQVGVGSFFMEDSRGGP